MGLVSWARLCPRPELALYLGRGSCISGQINLWLRFGSLQRSRRWERRPFPPNPWAWFCEKLNLELFCFALPEPAVLAGGP